MTEQKFCPFCLSSVEVMYVSKPDVDLKICEKCGGVVSIRYKDS